MFKNKKGFTLIELLIVITIIGILAVAFLPTILDAPAKGRDARRVQDLNAIKSAIAEATVEAVDVFGSTGITTSGCVDGNKLDIVSTYLQNKIPVDPTSDWNVGPQLTSGTEGLTVDCEGKYYINVTNSSYSAVIIAKLESASNISDAVACTSLADDLDDTSVSATDDADACYAVYIN